MGPIRNQIRKTISSRNRYFVDSNQGFTLIEIIVVIAVIALVMSLGMPTIERIAFQKVASTTRKLIGLIRTVRNDALLLSQVHRLAIDLDHHQWWVEAQKKFSLLGEDSSQNRGKKGSGNETNPNFSLVAKYGSKQNELPSGVNFQGLLKENEGLFKEGMAYIHFFPNGFNDHAILYVNKAGSEAAPYSLIVRPTAGRIEVVRARVDRFDVAPQ